MGFLEVFYMLNKPHLHAVFIELSKKIINDFDIFLSKDLDVNTASI